MRKDVLGPPTAFAGIVMALSLSILANRSFAEDWLQFRGPGSKGLASKPHPLTWSTEENIGWKTDTPGLGWSSPIVVAGKIYLTTVVNSGETEEPKKGLYFGGDRNKPVESEHSWRLICLDFLNGEVLWNKELYRGRPSQPIHIKNTYASETPVSDGKSIFVYFGNAGVYCVDLKGELVWMREMEAPPMRYGWGTASSPTIAGDTIYLQNDNEQSSFLIALEKSTGREKWRVPREEKSNWSSPFVWQNAVRTEIVTAGTQAVRSYDLDGQLLWSLTGMSSITIATPYEHNGLLVVSSGYVLDPKRPIYAIRPGATGDISLTEDANANSHIVWCQRQAAPYNPSTIAHEDRLFSLADRGLLTCLKSDNGELIYDRKRLPEGRAFTSSPWISGDHVFCLNEDGMTFAIPKSGEFQIVATNRLADDDMSMATPATVDGTLLIRTSKRIYAIRESK